MSCLRTWAPIFDYLTFHPVWLIFWRSSYLRTNCKIDHLQKTLWRCLSGAKRKTKRTSVFPNWKIWFVDGHLPHFWATILIPLGIPVFLAWEHMETDPWVDMGYGYGLKQLDNKMLTHAQRIVEVSLVSSTSHHIHMGQVSMLVFPFQCL